MFRHSEEKGVNWTLPLGAFCPQCETHTLVRVRNSPTRYSNVYA